MVSCLPWRSDNLHQVSLIENYPAPLTALGEPVRQVTMNSILNQPVMELDTTWTSYWLKLKLFYFAQGVFTVWEDSTEVRTASRGHQRQVFVFRECIVLCKVKRDLRMNSAIYSFKNKMKVMHKKMWPWWRQICWHHCVITLFSPSTYREAKRCGNKGDGWRWWKILGVVAWTQGFSEEVHAAGSLRCGKTALDQGLEEAPAMF